MNLATHLRRHGKWEGLKKRKAHLGLLCCTSSYFKKAELTYSKMTFILPRWLSLFTTRAMSRYANI